MCCFIASSKDIDKWKGDCINGCHLSLYYKSQTGVSKVSELTICLRDTLVIIVWNRSYIILVKSWNRAEALTRSNVTLCSTAPPLVQVTPDDLFIVHVKARVVHCSSAVRITSHVDLQSVPRSSLHRVRASIEGKARWLLSWHYAGPCLRSDLLLCFELDRCSSLCVTHSTHHIIYSDIKESLDVMISEQWSHCLNFSLYRILRETSIRLSLKRSCNFENKRTAFEL